MNNFSFTKKKNVFFIFTAICILLGIILCIVRPFNFGVDFAGGTQMKFDIGRKPENNDFKIVRKVVESHVKKGSAIDVMRTSDTSGDYVLVETTAVVKSQTFDEIINELNTNTANKMHINEETKVLDTKSSNVSSNLRKSAIIATIVAVLLMLVYIAFRFKLISAIAAVLCLIHDVFFVLVAYSILGISVTTNVIAVVLTILGYSINATIIIFDRIRENNKIMGKATSFEDKVDASIHQTIRRSLFTTVTTLLTIGMVYILGVASIREFALPLIVGIVVGLYSSVCLSGNIWCVLNSKFSKNK